MKKLLYVLMISALLLGTAACSNGKTSEPAETSPGTSAEGAPKEAPAAAESVLPAYEASVNDCGFDVGAVIAPTVLYDHEELATITATGLTYDDGAAILHLEIVNHTDVDLQFDTDRISVNRLMKGFSGFDFIAAGESVIEDVVFSYEELMPCGVTTLSEITIGELSLITMDDAWEETLIGPLTLYTNARDIVPAAESGYESMCSAENQQRFSYTVLGSSPERTEIAEGVYAAAAFLTVDEYESNNLVVELHNETDETVTVSLGSPVVNGVLLALECRYLVDLAPHCYSVFSAGLGEYGVPDGCFAAMGLLPIREIAFEYAVEPDGREASEHISSVLTLAETEPAETSEGKLVYDQDGLSVRAFGVVPSYEEDDYVGDASILLLIENNTGKELELQDEGMGDLLLNGKEIEFYSSFCTLPDGMKSAVSYTTINSLTGDLEIASVSELWDGQMTLRLYDSETFREFSVAEVPLF